jgi:hypothetical protein
MIRREPVLISTVTAIPGESWTGRPLDLHPAPVEADARSIDEFLAFGFARRAFRAGGLIPRLVLTPVACDGIARNAEHAAMQQPVAGEIEGIDLDSGALSGDGETDIAVQHHRLDLEIGVERYHGCECLSRRNDPSDRVHRQLLHHAVNRCGENLQLRLLFSLDRVLGETRGPLFGFREIIVERAAVLRFQFEPGLSESGRRGLGLAQLAPLNKDVMLLADKVLKLGEIGDLGADLLVVEIFAHVHSLVQQRDRCAELGDHRRDCLAFRVLLSQLAVDLRQLCSMFRRLAR